MTKNACGAVVSRQRGKCSILPLWRGQGGVKNEVEESRAGGGGRKATDFSTSPFGLRSKRRKQKNDVAKPRAETRNSEWHKKNASK